MHYTRIHNPTLHHDTNCSTTNAIATTLRTAHQTTATTPLRLTTNTAALHLLYPAIVGEVTDQVTIATDVTIPQNATPTTFQSIIRLAIRGSQQPNSPFKICTRKLLQLPSASIRVNSLLYIFSTFVKLLFAIVFSMLLFCCFFGKFWVHYICICMYIYIYLCFRIPRVRPVFGPRGALGLQVVYNGMICATLQTLHEHESET